MIADKYKDYMYNLIKKCMDEIGPREPCSENETKLANMMAEEWKPLCDSVELEQFTCSPTAFLGFFPVLIGLYLLAVVAYWFVPPLAFVFAAAGLIILVLQFARYKELLDRFFPRKKSQNVIGTIKPSGEIKRRVIVCGHIDSAYEFNLWLFLKNAAVPLMIFGVVAVLFLVGICLARSIAFFTGGADAGIYTTLGIAAVALYPILSLFLFFHTYVPVPGAMDDMAGVSVAAGLGKCLHDAKKDGGFFPENTEVVLIGMACEEAGLRGARRYVTRHLAELKQTPTHVIMLDGVYDEKFLTVITREICTGAKHDPKLVNLAMDVAKNRNWKMIKTVIPLGASDATEFSRAGISSVCLLCQDCSKLVPNYHTRYDTIEKIRPESLAVSLQVVIDMLEKIDKSGL